MNANRTPRYSLLVLLIAMLLVLSACQQAARANSLQPADTAVPVDQPAAVETEAAAEPAVEPAQPTAEATNEITMDYSAVAQRVTLETVAAVPQSDNVMYTVPAPQHARLTLEGYPVGNHIYKAQIFIYPVDKLASANENMSKTAAELQALLETQLPGDTMPYLPLINAAQMTHAQVQFLDFKSGKGVRYLTQFAQGMVTVANNELVYTFQGLTSDGKFYIAAVLPVTNPELPAVSKVNEELVLSGGYKDYITKTGAMLDEQPAATFTPDLSKLDAMIGSIEVK